MSLEVVPSTTVPTSIFKLRLACVKASHLAWYPRSRCDAAKVIEHQDDDGRMIIAAQEITWWESGYKLSSRPELLNGRMIVLAHASAGNAPGV
jgi:hypothetical protein